MGVTLERVQNKFACIIGELCNEPLVLSQFAVWVDLRIAEYKTNGKISLDCSGDSPNPTWMKGVKNERQRLGSNSVDTGQLGSHRQRGSYSSSPAGSPLYTDRAQAPDSPRLSHMNSHQTYSDSRLSPDVMVIKDEPNIDTQNLCAVGRKRLSDSGDFHSDYHSPSKSARLGITSSTLSTPQESSSNQSLMSIINAESDSVVLEQVEAGDSDIFRGSMNELELSRGSTSSNPAFSPQRPLAVTGSPGNQSAWPNQFGPSSSSSHTDRRRPGFGEAGSAFRALRDPVHHLYQDGNSPARFRASKLAAGAVKILKQWLVENTGAKPSDNIQDIAPEILDSHLAVFLGTIRKQDGRDYRPNSLRSLRQGIDFHLKESGYPHSILASSAFTASQRAYRMRMNSLTLQASPHKSAFSEHVWNPAEASVPVFPELETSSRAQTSEEQTVHSDHQHSSEDV